MLPSSKKEIFFLSVFSLSGMLQAEDFPRGFSKPQLSLGLSGFSIKEEALISRGSATVVEGHFLYGVDERLRLNLTPVASFISGQQTSRDPLSPLTNSIYLKEASVEQKLDYDISFKAGVLYQKEFLPSIAGYTKAFPGLGLKAPLIIHNHALEIRAQVAVPASSGLASTSSELESSASLYSATAFLRSSWTPNFSTGLSVSRFGFNKLSSSAASESIYRGNTIANVSVSTKAFVYKYEGHEVTLGTDYKSENFVMNLQSSFIKNNSAPTSLNQGYFVSVSPGMVLPTKSILHPVFEHYHVESDAMVAAYSDTTYGRTNRDGYRYGLALDTDRFRLSFIYAHSKLILNNPFQSADKTYFLNVNIDNL
jgi:hypothetical protein